MRDQCCCWTAALVLVVGGFCHAAQGLTNATRKMSERSDTDDYYFNYDDDEDSNSNNFPLSSPGDSMRKNASFNAEDNFLLPLPETVDNTAKKYYTVDILPNVDLPDDSLADTDLRDHDFIDNLMYVYYGSQMKADNGMGSEIIIVGSVLSCAAQLLTIFCALLRKNGSQGGRKLANRMFLNLMACLCLANLLFMLGVYATKNWVKCRLTALLLHYLHLLTSFWIFILCYHTYKRLSQDFGFFEMRYLLLLAYGSPALLVLFCFIALPSSYEVQRFCFISVQKGMMFNYMLPVALGIVSTTFFALGGIRKVNLELSKLELSSSESLKNDDMLFCANERKGAEDDEEVRALRDCKVSLRNLSLVQTSYAVVWFTSVLALENGPFSNIMPVLYAIFACLLNWYIFIRSKYFVPNIPTFLHPTMLDPPKVVVENKTVSEESAASRSGSSDNIPLLDTLEAAAPPFSDLKQLSRHDSISTISS